MSLLQAPPHSAHPAAGTAASIPLAQVPMLMFSMVRYRFFLFAGLLPYLMGSAWAYGMEGAFKPGIFWLGLLGILFSVVGVETFNEYFDSRLGTDRVFNPSDEDPIPDWVLYAGVAGFACAFACGATLAWVGGWPVMLYTLLGGLAAVFYVGPPIRWVYRGLGETMIALSYGPWMTLGSVHLHTGRFSWGALLASLVPGFLIMGLAVVNAVPDFYQDRLVGKRNLVVRLGRRNGVILYNSLAGVALSILAAGAAFGVFPAYAAIGAVAALPLLVMSYRAGIVSYEEPMRFVPAVKWIVLCYVVATSIFTVSLLAKGLLA
ncbi:MAG: prenyltransferase [Elusimicrobia bacterium]|nr:prenyltransferase [Elusimicrobiota bacterium]